MPDFTQQGTVRTYKTRCGGVHLFLFQISWGMLLPKITKY